MFRNPLWMLVNTTIFSEGVSEPRVMVETMIEMLTTLLQVLIDTFIHLSNNLFLWQSPDASSCIQAKQSHVYSNLFIPECWFFNS